jgi:haloalkane dehalogenase
MEAITTTVHFEVPAENVPTGEPLGPHFYEWRSLVRSTPDLPVGQWIRDTAPQLTGQEIAAYDAPFPGSRFQAGARTFPDLAMVQPEMEGVTESRAALGFWTEEWSGQSFMAIGMKDPDVETMQALRAKIRGCPEPMILPDVGHFVQEQGRAVARAALRAFGDL